MLCLHVFLGTFCLNPHFLKYGKCEYNILLLRFLLSSYHLFNLFCGPTTLYCFSSQSILSLFYILSVRIFVDVFHFLVCLLILLYIYLPHTTYIFSTIGRPNSSTSMNLSDYVGCNLIMVYNIKNKQHSFLYVYILFQLGKSFQTMLW